MFELTLSIDIAKQKYLHEFYKILENDLSKQQIVMASHNENKRAYLAIAIDDTKKEYLKAKVLEFITKIVVNAYKYEFFKEKLERLGTSMLFLPFLKAISIFDADTDYEVVKKEISFSGEILIDSLFYFKLAPLKNRWEKTAEIIIRNNVVGSEESMLCVLKYLTETSENFSLVANVCLSSDNLQIKNYKGTKNFKTTKEGIEKFFTEIISLNPLKINLTSEFGDENESKPFKILSDIFGEKIYIKN